MKSLTGRTVVVTRPRAQAAPLAEALEALGAEVVLMPVIEIREPESWDEADRSIKMLRENYFRWVIFSSSNAVESLFHRIDVLGLDARAFGRTGVAAVGPTTQQTLRRHGLRADLVPDEAGGTGLAEALGYGSGRILLPRPSDAPETTREALESRGWSVVPIVCYETVATRPRGPEADRVRRGGFDAVTFMSPSAVRAFGKLVGGAERAGLDDEARGPLVGCIGRSTAEAAKEEGFRVDAVPDEATAEALALALAKAFRSRESMAR